MFNQPDLVITKRHLGFILVALGVIGFGGLLILDALRGGGSDFGPTQLLALFGCVGLVLLGLTLIPLGDKPA